MRIHLIAVGTRMPAWVEQGYADYAGRLPKDIKLELVEIPLGQRGKNADLARVKQAEGEKVLKALPREALAVALDERGESWSSTELAGELKRWLQEAPDVALLIGGPDGHAPEVLARAQRRWSLSRLVLPHALVRVLVAEQIYRAWSLLANHPYHRA